MQVEPCFSRVLRAVGLAKNAPVLLGVSGGVDSMVLLYLCVQAGLRVVVAHVNYALRAKESEADARLVADAAMRYSCTLVQKNIDPETTSLASNVEEEARNLRYSWFRQLRQEYACAAILTAHHADDNVETALLNFLRPTGLLGIAAMPYKHEHLVRPLLDCAKADLYAFAQVKGIVFREDRTNRESRFLRNFLRNQILPKLLDRIPNLYAIITENIHHYQETYAIYHAYVSQIRAKYLREQHGMYVVSIGALSQLNPLRTWVYELFRPFVDSSRQLDAVMQLLNATSGKYLRTQHYEFLRYKTELQVIPRIQATAELAHNCPAFAYPVLIETLPSTKTCAKGKLSLELLANPGNIAALIETLKLIKDNRTIYLDAKELQLPLLLRPLRTGDYYYPLGLAKKKKILRVAREAGWNSRERAQIWVLEAANGHIVWVWGLRPDNRYKLQLSSVQALKIQIVGG